MTIRQTLRIAVVCGLASTAGLRGDASDIPSRKAPPDILETQLTLRLDPVRARATVVAVADETLTVVTAGHFLSPGDEGKTIQIHRGAGNFRGTLVSVARNPAYPQGRSRNPNDPSPHGTLGVDTAIAVIQVDLRGEEARRDFEKIQAADLAPQPIPSHPGQIVLVHIVDQFGKEHVVRAGNHLNPKCLAWGRRGYDAQRGDSGAGVFVMRRTAEGEEWPILIGNVSQTDDRGGIASLASRALPWIEKTMNHRDTEAQRIPRENRETQR